MRALLMEVVISLKLCYRDRQALFWSYLFPLMLLILFISTFGGGNPRAMSGILSGVICISIMIGTLFGIGIEITLAREEGILRRYQVTPLPKKAFVLGTIISRYVILLFSMLLLMGMAKLMYGIEVKGEIGSLFLIFSLGTFTFSSIGFTIASFAQTVHSASAMANVLFMPLILLSGATIPRMFLPEWVQNIAGFLPATYLVDAFEEVIVFGASIESVWSDLLVLFGFLCLGTLISIKSFRWE